MSNAAKIAVGVLAMLLMALPWLVNPYILQVFILTFTYSMLGLAFALTIKVGLPRFDVAAWFGVGAYSTALLMLKGGLSFWPSLLIGGVIAVALGWVIFVFAIPRGMMVFLMFGMATAMTIYQCFGTVPFFGGWSGTPVVPPPAIGSFVFVGKPALYYMGFFFLVANIAVYRLLYDSRIGRAWNAMGSSLKLASSVGINVVRYRMANVLIGNFFVAIAGGYFVAYSLVASPANFGFHSSLFVMMYAVVGGFAHSIAGPIVGAFVLTFTPEYFRVAKEYESIITAVVMILIIVFMPMGILGFYDARIKHRLARINWFRHEPKAGPQAHIR